MAGKVIEATGGDHVRIFLDGTFERRDSSLIDQIGLLASVYLNCVFGACLPVSREDNDSFGFDCLRDGLADALQFFIYRMFGIIHYIRLRC